MASPVSAVTTQTASTNSSNSTNSSSNSSSTSTGNQQISETTFLQLLVAQLQNQDPLQPMDGMQFVTQLAQFSQLESVYGIQKDTDTLVADASGATTSTSGSTTSTGGSGSTAGA